MRPDKLPIKDFFDARCLSHIARDKEMKRSLFLVSTVAAFGLMFASMPAWAGSPSTDCAACAAPPQVQLQMAQLGPMVGQAAQAAPRSTPRDDFPKEYGPLRTCCDPALAPIKGGTLFGLDVAPGSNFSANYGWNFLPTPAYTAAVNNTAFIANVMGGYSSSYLVLVADLKTDNNAAAGSSAPWSSATLPVDWSSATFTTFVPGPSKILGVWDSAPANTLGTNWFAIDQFKIPQVAPNHMRPDGTRYIAKLSYWLYFQVGKTWQKRQVFCNNVPEMYAGTRINTSAFKVAPGGQSGPMGEFISGSAAPAENSGMRMGTPQAVTPDELNSLPASVRNQ
jgi:hypothetical protein